MFKRTMCAALALLMLACAFPLAAFAEETALMGSGKLNGITAARTVQGDEVTSMSETEDNDSRSKADYISQDLIYVDGDVGNTGDKYDFFKITLKNSYYMEFAAVSGAGGANSTRFKLLDSDGDTLKTASYDGEEYTDDYFSFTYSLSPGTYYIRVSDSSNWVGYQFGFVLYSQLDQPKVTASNKAATGKPVLKWSAVDNATSYRIYRATSKSGTYSYLDSTKKTSFTDTTAKAGKTYYYKVKAMCASGDYKNSKYSAIDTVVCDCARPDVWLTHRSTTGKNIVKWDEVAGAKNYRVYVATSKTGTYKYLDSTTKLQLVHSSGASNKMYYYKVKAISSATSAADSAYSLVVGQKTK